MDAMIHREDDDAVRGLQARVQEPCARFPVPGF
jgi:hypothetical protein